MMQYHKLALAAAFGFAFALVLSCGEHSWDDLFGDDSSSSVAGGSSGSKEGGSSSSGGGNGGSSGSSSSSGGGVNAINGGCPNAVTANGTVTCGGQTYKTVVIGNQTWMAENLNYAVKGAKCYGEGGIVDGGYRAPEAEVQANCNKYGRLYYWAMAMDMDEKYNSQDWKGSDVNHQGICPTGWHLPNNADWDELYHFVDDSFADGNTESPYNSETAGRFLKAKEGWENCRMCEDKYGFSALPGGTCYMGDYPSFIQAGIMGRWWSSSDYDNTIAYGAHAWFRFIQNASEIGFADNALDKKYHLLSVRCVKDGSISSSSSGIDVPSSCPDAVTGNGTVSCGGKTYKTVVIDSQTWMAENLNYAVRGSKCGGEDTFVKNENTVNCDKYGRLYSWTQAMDIDEKYNRQQWKGSDVKRKGVCPTGWHLPSNKEWDALYRFADGKSGTSSPYYSETAGKYLKATSGWKENDYNGKSGNGEDKFGFSALPGGRGFSGGHFEEAGTHGYWWSSSEYTKSNVTEDAYYREMLHSSDGSEYIYSSKNRLQSVRCVKD